MELRPIIDLSAWYNKELAVTFPEHERKPLDDIRALIAAGHYEPLGLYDGSVLLGYATLWGHPEHPGSVLLDYFGVPAARRGGGLGGALLRQLQQWYPERAILAEAEALVPGEGEAENHLRGRRIAFYERVGFRQVYDMATCGVRFCTLVLGPTQELEGLQSAHRAIYGPARTDVRVPLGPDETPQPPYWMK